MQTPEVWKRFIGEIIDMAPPLFKFIIIIKNYNF
jgi:hypothetical protein